MIQHLSHSSQSEVEVKLNSFDPRERAESLRELADRVESGAISVPSAKREVNLHFHTFFSFNANGWSPSRIAWEAKKYGLEVAGIVDFDVLDGMDEFLRAGDLLHLKTTVEIETRVFLREYSGKVMTSPNEPGVTYFMAAGCFKRPPAGSEAERILTGMARTARARNLGVMERVNAYLGEVQLDYDRDVIPLTPSGNATERHMLLAYDLKANELLGDAVAGFWSRKLEIPLDETRALIADAPKFHERLRSKLMKFGGVGYVPPDSGSFPPMEDAVKMILAMEALPMATWLDGTNDGEHDMMTLLDMMESKGIVGMNMVPDRNWNLKNPEEKRIKLANLGKAVRAAKAHDFPLCIGTEMNKAGLPFVDDFAAPELKEFVSDFLAGAAFYFGHTLLARYADVGFCGKAAKAAFGSDRRAKNAFFTKVGGLPMPSADVRERLREKAGCWEPEEIIELLSA